MEWGTVLWNWEIHAHTEVIQVCKQNHPALLASVDLEELRPHLMRQLIFTSVDRRLWD